ncbi:PilT/PilU family type 4a pilus ATPase [Luteimonas sp. 50]|uniref:PilT/PilU family type 4a pilus ATPase n=1 Tax=Cognatiluteimonas sedimenti TaxID=2927791 RepID=A0ABT0A6C1_9GAMM|nr:PilT/PilU family type 4a pilus ATPase [Lysobacter sedimenti]MCJ0826490.1 PilT/PilU family type 4a pilus ATPase [Lysobacter sedimenti]
MNTPLHDSLRQMVDAKASDLFFSVGAPPALKIDGILAPLDAPPLTADVINALAMQAMNERQQREFEDTMEMNLAIDMADAGRVRVNLYRQRGNPAIAVRYITSQIPTLEQLNLPPVLDDLALAPRGLVLVVGAAGAGKSTTLASLIDHLNTQHAVHILTVEDPIEYIHTHKKSIVDQREVGLDTRSYANALRNTMREAPDVLMIGEIRDQETMQAAIAYAETGHLCLATLHANSASQTLDRIINFFPDSTHHQLFVDLSLNLKAVISQRLLRGVDGRRLPAVEILLWSPFVAELIEKGEIAAIRDAMKQSFELGMLTFDESIYRLYAAGRISYDEAMDNADSRTDLGLRIRLEGPHPPGGDRDELAGARVDGLDAEGRPEPAEEATGYKSAFGATAASPTGEAAPAAKPIP